MPVPQKPSGKTGQPLLMSWWIGSVKDMLTETLVVPAAACWAKTARRPTKPKRNRSRRIPLSSLGRFAPKVRARGSFLLSERRIKRRWHFRLKPLVERLHNPKPVEAALVQLVEFVEVFALGDDAELLSAVDHERLTDRPVRDRSDEHSRIGRLAVR